MVGLDFDGAANSSGSSANRLLLDTVEGLLDPGVGLSVSVDTVDFEDCAKELGFINGLLLSS